ncbi:chemotaxis protein MotB [Desulfobaculum xiamenense]|uniref:Chemotaxis protein MotB n=1 Tax=Desulfobaculum xiamenense TaxID=995050 RepID=A0A846QPN0_9BACT|nr:OmpA family protein [Desulfobaculum xiamenense]NJB68452.1 chemotaxis protein MotB [Desulfobaculum xiamenense]
MGEQIQIPKRKDDGPEVQEGLPEWMATFADMMTLLLCFFVLLLSFANQDLANFRTLMGSIRDAFGVQKERPQATFAAYSPTRLESKGVKLNQDQRVVLDLTMQLRALVEDDTELKRSAGVTAEREGVLVRVESAYLFDQGKASLRPGSEKMLENVLKILKEYNFNCVIRGHTDDREEGGSLYPSNWELSSARAAAALRWLVEKGGIEARRLKAVGYAGTRPLVPNDRAEDRTRNRRVEFLLHRPETETW